MREVARYFAFALSKFDPLISPKNSLITSSIRPRVLQDVEDKKESATAAAREYPHIFM
jgi:hypothetical protein